MTSVSAARVAIDSGEIEHQPEPKAHYFGLHVYGSYPPASSARPSLLRSPSTRVRCPCGAALAAGYSDTAC